MASHDDVGIGDFVLLDEITVERVVKNLKTRYVFALPGRRRRRWPLSSSVVVVVSGGWLRDPRHRRRYDR